MSKPLSRPLTDASLEAAAVCREVGRADVAKRLLDLLPLDDASRASVGLQRGLVAIELGDFGDAERHLLRAEQSARNSIQRSAILTALGRAYHGSGRHRAAVEAFIRADSESFIRADAWVLMGDSLAALGSFQEALDAFCQAAKLDSENVEAVRGQARCLRELGRLHEALAAFDRAVALAGEGSESLETLAGRAETLRRLERKIEADAVFDRLLARRALTINEALTQANVAVSLNRPETRKLFHALIERYPDNATAWISHAGYSISVDDYEAAINSAARATQLEPDNVRARAITAVALQRSRRFVEAVEAFKVLVKADPTSAWAASSLGDCLWRTGVLAEAVEAFNIAIKLEPEDLFSLVWRGMTYRALEQYEEAARDFEAARKLSPEDAWAPAMLGAVYRRQGKLQAALEQLSIAIKHNPTLDWARQKRAQVYLDLGKPQEALLDLTNPAMAGATSWPVHLHAVAQYMMGRQEEAQTLWQKALRLEEEAVRSPLRPDLPIDGALLRTEQSFNRALYLAALGLVEAAAAYEEALLAQPPPARHQVREGIRDLEDVARLLPRHFGIQQTARSIAHGKLLARFHTRVNLSDIPV